MTHNPPGARRSVCISDPMGSTLRSWVGGPRGPGLPLQPGGPLRVLTTSWGFPAASRLTLHTVDSESLDSFLISVGGPRRAGQLQGTPCCPPQAQTCSQEGSSPSPAPPPPPGGGLARAQFRAQHGGFSSWVAPPPGGQRQDLQRCANIRALGRTPPAHLLPGAGRGPASEGPGPPACCPPASPLSALSQTGQCSCVPSGAGRRPGGERRKREGLRAPPARGPWVALQGGPDAYAQARPQAVALPLLQSRPAQPSLHWQ